MTETSVPEVVEDGVVGEPRQPRRRIGRPRNDADAPKLISDELAGRLVEQARAEGVDIAGRSGLLQQLMKSVQRRRWRRS